MTGRSSRFCSVAVLPVTFVLAVVSCRRPVSDGPKQIRVGILSDQAHPAKSDGSVAQVADASRDGTFTLASDSPFYLVARGDIDLNLSLTNAGAFATRLPCDVPRERLHPKQSGEPRLYEPWNSVLQIRHAEGGVWVDDTLAQTPSPEWTAFEAIVKAHSLDDVWVERVPGSRYPGIEHGFFHWNGTRWEDITRRLSPKSKSLYPSTLLDWQASTLVPYLPIAGDPYEQRVLPQFGVWGNHIAPPSFRTMSATEPMCPNRQYYLDDRYGFGTLPSGDVFVVEHACEEAPETAATRVGHWSKGKVTVKNFPSAYLNLTAGKLGVDEVMLLWGSSRLQSGPILQRFLGDAWAPIALPTEVKGHSEGVRGVGFGQDGTVWVDFGETDRIWHYDGAWDACSLPEPGTEVQLETARSGDIWASAGYTGLHLYRLHQGSWEMVPLFRAAHNFGGVRIQQFPPNDVWIQLSTREATHIYRNRQMQLLACP